MKATGLRIGNYYYGCSRKQLEIVTGQTIAQRESGELPCMKPIPLTEEWLLKFGFKKDTWTNNDLIIGHWWNNGSILITDDFKLDGQEDMKPLQYLHQLQNLFYCLCGEELTFKSEI
jgi:hypothetical protein